MEQKQTLKFGDTYMGYRLTKTEINIIGQMIEWLRGVSYGKFEIETWHKGRQKKYNVSMIEQKRFE